MALRLLIIPLFFFIVLIKAISKFPKANLVQAGTSTKYDGLPFIQLPTKVSERFNNTKLEIIRRKESSKKIVHLEVYKQTWYYPIKKRLPSFINRPIAKTGLRTYSSSGQMMDGLISRIFGDTTRNVTAPSTNTSNNNGSSNVTEPNGVTYYTPAPERKFHPVAIFVYMVRKYIWQ